MLGKWTPNAHNSRTRKNIKFRGIKFRSSWEVVFYAATNFEYEKLRIPYISERGINRIYITDFLDKNNNVYEIKPKAQMEKNEHKLNCAREWCKNNGYNFIIINEGELLDLIKFDNLPHSEIDDETLYKIKKLYEANKKI